MPEYSQFAEPLHITEIHRQHHRIFHRIKGASSKSVKSRPPQNPYILLRTSNFCACDNIVYRLRTSSELIALTPRRNLLRGFDDTCRACGRAFRSESSNAANRGQIGRPSPRQIYKLLFRIGVRQFNVNDFLAYFFVFSMNFDGVF